MAEDDDFLIPAAFVQVTDVKRHMEGTSSEDEEHKPKVKYISDEEKEEEQARLNKVTPSDRPQL